jgi:hypothetical protein
MKKITLFVLLLAVCVFGQVPMPGEMPTAYIVRTDSVLSANFIMDTTAGLDTIWSETFRVWPFMSVAAEVTSSDSLCFKVDLFQWFRYREYGTYAVKTADQGKFVFVKTLDWNSPTTTGLDSLTAAGGYAANITDAAIMCMPLARLRVRQGVTGGNLKRINLWLTSANGF